MNYGVIKDGVITAPLTMCSKYEGIGAWHTLTDEERAVYGWFPCDLVNESYDPRTQSRSQSAELSFNNQRITATYSVVAKSLGTIHSELLQRLAEHRYGFETQGLELSTGLRILTDRESQGQLGNSYTMLKNGLVPDTDWKGVNGWQVVQLAEIEPIAQAVAAHVRGCFRGERAVGVMIQATTQIKSAAAIDIPTLFAAAYQEAFNEVMKPEPVTE